MTHLRVFRSATLILQKLELVWCTYIDVQGDIADGSSAIVEVNCEVVQTDLLFQKLAQVVLKEVATSTLLNKLGDSEKPRHSGPLLCIHKVARIKVLINAHHEMIIYRINAISPNYVDTQDNCFFLMWLIRISRVIDTSQCFRHEMWA